MKASKYICINPISNKLNFYNFSSNIEMMNAVKKKINKK